MTNVLNLPSAEQMDELNANLFGILRAQTSGGLNPTSWADVQTYVRRGLASKIFAIGDQLSCKKGDGVLVWDIIGIDHDTPSDPQFTHSLTLQLHDQYKTAMQFDAPEAMLAVKDTALAAGTYHFTIAATWSKAVAGTYQFTLTKEVPVGGCIAGPERLADVEPVNWKVSTYSSVSSTTVIETVAVTSGSSGQSIGTLTPAGDFANNLNSIHRIGYGSNNYKASAMRQWLNSDAAAGSVWTSQTDYDRPPSWAANTAGWMNGMDADFLAVIGKTHIVVSRNTVCDGGGSDEMDDTFFLLSRREVFDGNEVANVIEGEPYPYYANYSDLSAAGTGADSNRIKYRAGTAQYWWLRSPYAGNGAYARYIGPTGAVNYYYAYFSYGVAPACCII